MVKVRVMTSYLSSLVSDTAPGVALVFIAVIAAVPPYQIVCQSTRGRARSAIGYLLGLGAGLAATIALGVVAGASADTSAIGAAGLLASFFAPFAGLARGKWQSTRRPPRRRSVAEGIPR
jgi:hypothetical protein